MTRAEARLVHDDFSQDCWGSRQPPAKSHGAVAPARPGDAVLWLEMESPTSHNMESRLHTPTRHQTLEKIAYSFLYSRHHPAKTHRLCFYREAFAVLHSLPGNSSGKKKKKVLAPPFPTQNIPSTSQNLPAADCRRHKSRKANNLRGEAACSLDLVSVFYTINDTKCSVHHRTVDNSDLTIKTTHFRLISKLKCFMPLLCVWTGAFICKIHLALCITLTKC